MWMEDEILEKTVMAAASLSARGVLMANGRAVFCPVP